MYSITIDITFYYHINLKYVPTYVNNTCICCILYSIGGKQRWACYRIQLKNENKSRVLN